MILNARRTEWESRRACWIANDEQKQWFERQIRLPLQILYKQYILELLLRQKPLPPSQNGRHIPLKPSHERPLVDERRKHSYISNNIRSSLYTLWNFLPKQFFFQATRLANFYFICIGIPQTIPGFSTTGNYTTILPLCFFLLLTIVKEGFDDYRRHRLDKVENNTRAVALRERYTSSHTEALQTYISRVIGLLSKLMPIRIFREFNREPVGNAEETDEDDTFRWARVKWHDIKVGDILKLSRDEAVPADVVLLYASGEDGVAYVETMALDGETNLKSKQAPPTVRDCRNIDGIRSFNAEVVTEDPNRNLYDFNGSLSLDGKTLPLTLNNVLLRGSVLRNTAFAIGVVFGTGEECKIRLHANHHPKAKKPRLERYTNQVVLTLIVYVVILSVGCSVGYILWHDSTERHSWYLNDAYVPFKQIIIGYLIMFNNVIPLALYISLEIVKIGQMLMISGDEGMFDEASNTPMTCNTNTILENLGQVRYVLSDKTGTLTENVMRFRGLSVAGMSFVHHSPSDFGADGRRSIAVETRLSMQQKSAEQAKSSAGNHESAGGVIVSEKELPDSSAETARQHSNVAIQSRTLKRTASARSRSQDARRTTLELLTYIRHNPTSEFSRAARELILGIALCHTALPERQQDGTTDFQASSPDEIALVRVAQELGFFVMTRSSQSIILVENDSAGARSEHTYQILDIIEFSSKRKRMSIIVRCPDGRIWLLCKGADSAIVPRLKQAALAARKSHEVRRSVQIERDLRRKSEHDEPRNSFGGRPSFTVQRGSSMDIRPAPKRNTLEVPGFSHAEKPFNFQKDSRSMESGRLTSFDALSTFDEATMFTRCFVHLDQFATEGLRTLLFANRYLTEQDYVSWKNVYQEASTALADRQERIESAGELLEQGFDLLGASAIEDKLQDGVPETISKLRRANMKIWMLTGDKRETALNIAHSACICQQFSEIFILDSSKGNLECQLRDAAEDLRNRPPHSVAVIDGHTLEEVESSQTLTALFYSIILAIDSVICCRASPSQKASVVKGIRSRTPGLTLAIGDGANDVAMITSSHVGIGISGKEGLQAARVADFSIAQFRFLQRLLLVHGRWSYVRTAKFILWTYWKEMFFYMVQAMYQRSTGYTGSSLYENWSLTVLNTLFTSLCVILPGMFEQDLKAETLLAVPELYTFGQRNRGLNLPQYALWMVLATIQGVLIYVLPWTLYGKYNTMGDNGAFAIGDLCFSLAIMWTNVKLLIIETHYKTSIVLVGFGITVSGWWAWNAFLASAYSDNLSPFDVKGGFTKTFGQDPVWWLVLLVTLAVLLAMELIWRSAWRALVRAGRLPSWRSTTRSKEESAEELDVSVWQELERDPGVLEKLNGLASDEVMRHDEDTDGVAEIETG